MTDSRLVVWLARHPLTAVVVLLAMIALFSASVAALVRPSTTPTTAEDTGEAVVAPSTLPTPTQRAPQDRVGTAHRALHALNRACKTPMAQRARQAIRGPLDEIERFATDFPSAGFDVDGETATTLALLVVVWDQLKACDPSYVPEVEALLPAEYRDGA